MKRVSELPRPAKHHSRYADIVATEGWVPLILCDRVGCYWDTFTVQTKAGRTHTGISRAAQEHFVHLLQAGHFGTEARDAFVDHKRWEYIRDNLLDCPSPEIIARDSLRILPLR